MSPPSRIPGNEPPDFGRLSPFSEMGDHRCMIFGIDTASVAGNRNPDWMKAKATGPISFALIRSNFGTTPDKSFSREWPRIRDAGLVRGAYLFLRFPRGRKSAPTPEDQAAAAIDTIGDLEEGDLPPALDVEFPGNGRSETGLSVQACMEGVQQAWEALQAAYGCPPLVYTSARVWRDDLKNAPVNGLGDSPLWLARFPFRLGRPAIRDASVFDDGAHDPPVPKPWGDAGLWWIHQYQGDALEFPGFNGKVDMNRFNAARPGSRGDRIGWLQRRLGIAETEVFDSATQAAVRAFQTARELSADGIVGPRTFAFLARLPAPE